MQPLNLSKKKPRNIFKYKGSTSKFLKLFPELNYALPNIKEGLVMFREVLRTSEGVFLCMCITGGTFISTSRYHITMDELDAYFIHIKDM